MNRLYKLLALGLLVLTPLVGPSFLALGQGSLSGQLVQGTAVNTGTKNTTIVITTGNTFQTALVSIIGDSTTRRQALTIQNNNTTTDNCWLYLGAKASATKATAILLAPGQAYTRYWPFVPADEISVTCATTNDTMYVDNQ